MRVSAFRIAERMLRSGSSCDAVAAAVHMHRSAVYRLRLEMGLPRRWFPLSDAERRAIRSLLLANLSRREVARRTGRGLGTVARVGNGWRHGTAGPQRVRQAYRCPGCGFLIRIRPCLICASGGAEDALTAARRAA